ncbi:preprotein translocase subunit SecA [Nocardioides sp. zg-1228]|uniref:preprotein translocase subunit SecA n=1 Tax=Nocardioides sp. zg-1228 TaxID=2763008 RepID=UPI001642C86B|nr:preprotein translocase subunit SecA [Nocardioides sp. zg-1228]MBC2933096.1 preprotein translocase subunit SecA [Nocardioides sp. zg-1228]QSF56716.1 hypothetical protein JX575_14020 [Nocardioides sp. zg-1228]
MSAMASKTKRKNARKKRGRTTTGRAEPLDPHVRVATAQTEAIVNLMAEYADADDPAAAIGDALATAVEEFTAAINEVEPARLIEVVRLACLPWAPEGEVREDADSAPSRAELMALIAITAAVHDGSSSGPNDAGDPAPGVQPLTDLVHGRLLPAVDRLFHLAQLREMAQADFSDQLAVIAAYMRGAQVWIRSSSYPDRVEDLYMELFSEPAVRQALIDTLGFDARQAHSVLGGLHDVQVGRLNDRMIAMRVASTVAMSSTPRGGTPNPNALAVAKAAWTAAWEPPTAQVVVGAAEIADTIGLPPQTVQSVLDFFSLDTRSATALDVVHEFTSGANPLRVHPVLALSDGFMLVHNADLLAAVREAFEEHLKTTSSWERYAKHRGELLEQRSHGALAKVLPDASYREGFEYYVPASPDEEGRSPSTYTKRVEGDHLVVQDDVAIIIEDKAVAISPGSREGETRRLRRDLTGIVTKAADQAGRLRERILVDGGIQVHGEGWIDLTHIREIHTVAVSIEDLMGVSTATAQLAIAGIIPPDNIPWTVSILDLDLIAELIDHPAELLLYLRRRRALESTVMYTAPDELDLFLHFFSAGLYVEEDPHALRETYPWMGEVRTAERRRYERQRPVYLTSRTDALDHWHYAQLAGQGSVPKPAMAHTELRPLLDQLRARKDYAWLSICATLLAGSEAAQSQMAKIPVDLLHNPFAGGRRRRMQAMPLPQSSDRADGWLVVWMTRPPGFIPAAAEQDARDYLRVKKHQWGLSRGVVLEYSEATRDLIGVWFDDHSGELDDALKSKAKALQPAEAWTSNEHPKAKKRSGSR